jgi:hypothetical protein
MAFDLVKANLWAFGLKSDRAKESHCKANTNQGDLDLSIEHYPEQFWAQYCTIREIQDTTKYDKVLDIAGILYETLSDSYQMDCERTQEAQTSPVFGRTQSFHRRSTPRRYAQMAQTRSLTERKCSCQEVHIYLSGGSQ